MQHGTLARTERTDEQSLVTDGATPQIGGEDGVPGRIVLSDPPDELGVAGYRIARTVSQHCAQVVELECRELPLVACGIADHAVTSLERELERELGRNFDRPGDLPGLEAVAHEAARQFGLVFGEQVLAVESLEALRAQAKTAAVSRPEFPAEDTPVRGPAEVERLFHKEGRSIQA